MKALTVKRPWSHAIAHGRKRIENRTWEPPAAFAGQRFAIHAGNSWDEDCNALCVANRRGVGYYVPPGPADTPTGIVAVATFHRAVDLATARGLDAGMHAAWAHGPVCWVLTDVLMVPNPVAVRGALGLWDLPSDVEAAVIAQVR